jgi:lipopolysaccharide assembly protein A
MLRSLVVLLVVAVFVIGAALGYFNSAQVDFNYLSGSTHLSLVSLIIGSFVVGALFMLLLCAVRMLGLNRDLRRLRRQLRDAETELKNLRSLPLAPDR